MIRSNLVNIYATVVAWCFYMEGSGGAVPQALVVQVGQREAAVLSAEVNITSMAPIHGEIRS